MNQGVHLLIYPVTDLVKAKERFEMFTGVKPYVDSPAYVGYRLNGQEIGLDPNGHRVSCDGPISYWDVDNIHNSLRILLESGGEILQDIRDIGGGSLIAIAKGVDGNIFGLRQPVK